MLTSFEEYQQFTKYLKIFYLAMIMGAVPTLVGIILDLNSIRKYNIYVLFMSTFQQSEYYFYGGMFIQSIVIMLFPIFLRIKWTVIREQLSHDDKHPYSKLSRLIRRTFSLLAGFLIFVLLLGSLCYSYIYHQNNNKKGFMPIDSRDAIVGSGLFIITYVTEILLYGLMKLEVHDKRNKDESSLFWKKFIHRVFVLYLFTTIATFVMKKPHCYLINMIVIYYLEDFIFRNLFGMLIPFVPEKLRKRQIMLSEEYSDAIFKYFISVVYCNLIPTLSLISLLSLVWNELFMKIRIEREEGPVEIGSKLTKHIWTAVILITIAGLFFTNFSITFLYTNSRNLVQPYCFQ
eukprot:NODE_170_length_16226_cov_0.451169.p5 type:complete len:346 gc:universal NODE_170_length_16226_cov_0.451169:10380-9343(-)